MVPDTPQPDTAPPPAPARGLLAAGRSPLTALCVAVPSTPAALTVAGVPWPAQLLAILALIGAVTTVLLVQIRTPQDSGHRLTLACEHLKHARQTRNRKRPQTPSKGTR